VSSEDKASTAFTGIAGDLTYKKLARPQDPERRLERLAGDMVAEACDLSGLTGMPKGYVNALSEYTNELLSSIRAVPLSRKRYYCADSPDATGAWYPLGRSPIYDRNVIIPLLILPRPNAVNRWAESSEGQQQGWRSKDQALSRLGSVFGRSVIFERGSASKNPTTIPAVPYENGVSAGLFVYSDLFLRLGKLVTSPRFDHDGNLVDITADLAIGSPGGAKVRGEYVTTPVSLKNSRLRWVDVQNGKDVCRFLSYPLIDGNGAWRDDNPDELPVNPISSFVRPLTCTQHHPRILQHDQLLLPTPLGWPATESEATNRRVPIMPNEDWCLDDWFPAQKDACWVIREAEDSKPLQESFLLMPASEKSDRPVFFIALFAETEPKQLLTELAALYNVSADKALNSPETMARLNSLYEKIRDFPLDK
jgi:hypothetical protein